LEIIERKLKWCGPAFYYDRVGKVRKDGKKKQIVVGVNPRWAKLIKGKYP
jgi:hypothetical protein